MAAPVPVAYVAERRRVADLARRAAGGGYGYPSRLVRRRPRCRRCGGWLYVEVETAGASAQEVCCINCGNREYLEVMRVLGGKVHESVVFERYQRIEVRGERAPGGDAVWRSGYVLQRYAIQTARGEAVYTYHIQLDDGEHGHCGAGELRAESKEQTQRWQGR